MSVRRENMTARTPVFEGPGRTGALVGGATRFPVNTAVAAAGTDQTNAALLADGMTVVSGADGTKGVILPVPVAGMQVWIKGTANAVLKVYPNSGAQINALTATTGAISLASGLTPAIFIAISATQWYTFPLLPS